MVPMGKQDHQSVRMHELDRKKNFLPKRICELKLLGVMEFGE
jgi:hypothetical protein